MIPGLREIGQGFTWKKRGDNLTNLFVSNPPEEGHEIAVSGEDHHYLARVLRVSPGTEINLLDGKGGVFFARVREVGKKETLIQVEKKLEINREPKQKIHLMQAIPKKDRFEYILEKGTELGITSFIPLQSSRTVKQVKREKISGKMERWKNIIRSSAQQAGRTVLPNIEFPVRWEEIKEISKHYDCLLWAWEKSENSLGGFFQGSKPGEKVLLVIGPEGSFSPEEEEDLQELGFWNFSLGDRILRSDTAGLVAATIILHLTGDLGE